MDIFLKILGALFSGAMIFFGLLFVIKPTRTIQAIQQLKYKQKGEPRKIEKTFSIIFGSVMSLIGLYLLVIVILAFIYPE